MTLLLNLILIGLISFGFYRLWRVSPIASFYWPALLLKILCGLGFIAIYRYYYGWGDIFNYHQQTVKLADLFWQNRALYLDELAKMGFLMGDGRFWGSERVDFFVRLISPFYIITGKGIWLTACWLSLLSFLGLFWLSHRFSLLYTDSGLAAAGAFLFWPSVLFWTCSVSKEAVVMPSIAMVVAVALPYIQGKGSSTPLQWLLALLAAWVVWRIKYYFALPLFTILAALILAQYLSRWQVSNLKKGVLLCAGAVLAAWLISQLHPNLYPERVLGVLTDNYYDSSLLSKWDNQLYYKDLQPSIWSILYYSPKALAGGLLMPLPLIPPDNEILPLIAGVENLLVLLLIIGAYYKLYRLPYTNISLPAAGLVLYVCFLAIAMAIAAPNFGTLLRYRSAYLPFAIFLLLYWLFPIKLTSRKL